MISLLRPSDELQSADSAVALEGLIYPMAYQRPNPVLGLLETIIARPLLATLAVGISILLLQAAIHWLTHFWPKAEILRYIVPFLPPFVITSTAYRINQRRTEHDFIKDALPIIFIAYPTTATPEGLLESHPIMLSDSTARHLNRPRDYLFGQETLAAEYLDHPSDRERIVNLLLEEFQRDGRFGALSDIHIVLRPHNSNQPVRYSLNSVLTLNQGRLKWQGSLMRYHDWKE